MAMPSTRTAAEAKKPAASRTKSVPPKSPATKSSRATASKSAASKPKTSPAKKETSATTSKAPSAKKPAVKKPAAPRAKPTTHAITAPSPEQRYKMIQDAAYFLAEKNGFASGSMEYWVTAEAQIDAMLSGKKK